MLALAGVLVFLFTFCVDYSFQRTRGDGVIMDLVVENQRDPWVSVNVRKFPNTKGSYNFKITWQIVRNIVDADVALYKWPLIPYLLPDGFYLNMTMTAKACEAIQEDFFHIFSGKESPRPCLSEKNIIKKGNYTFYYNIDNAELVHEQGLGTTVYLLDLTHQGAQFLRMRFLVDTNILVVRKKQFRLKRA